MLLVVEVMSSFALRLPGLLEPGTASHEAPGQARLDTSGGGRLTRQLDFSLSNEKVQSILPSSQTGGGTPVSQEKSLGNTVLVVDDDPLLRKLVAAILEPEEFKLEVLADAEAAWQRLNDDSTSIVAMVLDRQLPGMGGLDLLMRMKQHPAAREVPVVMLSGMASTEDIVSGIAAGAFYYVTKPYDPALLRSIVRAAVDDHRQLTSMRERLESTANAIGLMEVGTFRLRTPEDAQALAELLSKLCPQPAAVVTGLWELLLNAIEHGNLGIDYHEKSALMASDTWHQEIGRRLAAPEFRERYAEVSVDRGPATVTFRITDQGQGFNPTRYLDFDPQRLTHTHGRGIAMARRTSFANVSYNDRGNAVEASVKC